MTITDEDVDKLLEDLKKEGIHAMVVGEKELDLMEKGEFSEETAEESK